METGEREKKDRLYFQDKIRSFFIKYKGIFQFFGAFILSDAELLGDIRPFGICYAVSLGEKDRLWAYAGAFFGSLIIRGGDGIIYCAACIGVMALDIFVFERSGARELFMPCITGLVTVILKAPFALTGGPGSIMLLIFEGFTASCAGYAMTSSEESGRSDIRAAAVALGFMSAFAYADILDVISPSASAAALVTMAAVYTMPAFKGAAVGLISGVVFDMAVNSTPFFAWILGITGAALSLTGKKSRVGFGLGFLAVGTACAAWGIGDGRAQGCIYDLFIAASVFLLLPDDWLVPYSEEMTEEHSPCPAEGLERLRKIMETVSVSIGNQIDREKNSHEDICVIFDNASSSVCRKCPQASECWVERYMDTFGWMCDLLPVIREKGRVTAGDMPEGLAGRCIKKDQLCGAVNQEYMAFLRRKGAGEREKFKDILLKEQYEGLTAAVDGLARSVRCDYAPAPVIQNQVRNILRAYGRRPGAEVFYRRGRLNMRIGVFDEDEPWEDEQSFIRSVSEALGKSFTDCERIPYKRGEALLYREKEALGVLISSSVRRKPGEELCGDSHICFRTEDGRAVIMISDGMGSGKEASGLSKNALELMTAFVKSGCTVAESAAAVLPLLKARWGYEGFATLDALEIELFTGRAQMIKCGASDSCLVRDGTAEYISKPSLPPGAGGSVKPEPFSFNVREGDRIIMTSDGAELRGCPVLTKAGLSAGEIIAACGSESDDVTAIVLSAEGNKNGEEGQ